MSDSSLWAIQAIFLVLGATFLFLSAIFFLWETLLQGRYEHIRAWFQVKWETVNSSPWLRMPEIVIKWILQIRTSFLGFFLTYISVSVDYFFLSLPILLSLACWFHWGIYVAMLSIFISLPSFLLCSAEALESNLVTKVPYWQKLRLLFLKLPKYSHLSIILLSFFIAFALWTLILLNINIYYAAFIMVLLLPTYWLIIMFPIFSLLFLRWIHTKPLGDASGLVWPLTFGIAVSISFTITFLALLFGHIACPDAWIPQTFRMLVSNVICDGITMLATFAILEYIIAYPGILRIPTAILLDIFIAALLACCSLYFSLVNTEHSLSVRQILNILFAMSIDRNKWEIGPYFWVMHTTFLPTLFYLAVILTCWIGKVLLLLAKLFFRVHKTYENPLRLTATMCGVFGAFFTLLASVVHVIKG